MPQLLHLDSSADLRFSFSRAVTAHFSNAWHELGPDYSVIYRDLHVDPPPHLPTSAMHWAPRLRQEDEVVPAGADALQTALIQELISADVVLIGAPMYNWSIPSTLKAWVDYIHVPGVTATFDVPSTPLKDKPVVIVSSRGGSYGPGTPNESADHTIPQLQQVLGAALEMDVSVIVAELTLAERVPAMADLIPQSHANLDAARAEASRLASALGTSAAARAEQNLE